MEPSLGIFILFAFIVIVIFSIPLIRKRQQIRKDLQTRVSNTYYNLQSKKTELDSYRSYVEYLPLGRRRGDARYVAELERNLKASRLLVGRTDTELVRAGLSLAREIKDFLHNYPSEYVKVNIERHQDFFQDKSLDTQQKEAIVKDDRFTIVNAGAGSGKTHILLNRLLYLAKCRNVQSDKILMLTFTKSAQIELQRRLRRSGMDASNVYTFHGFGLKLLKESRHRKRYAVEKRKVPTKLRELIESLTAEDDSFANSLLEYPVELSKAELEEIQLEDPNFLQYLGSESRQKRRYITLNEIPVKSITERDIANFLFRHQVRFIYEYVPPWPDPDPHYRPYEADFYLPDHDLYIEHWGIDREGNTAKWFNVSEEGYRKRICWKWRQFENHKKILLETFYYQSVEGTLTSDLESQLKQHGVVLNELSTKQLKQEITKHLEQQPLIDLMERFITDAKTQGSKPNDVRTRLSKGNWSRNVKQFASLVLPVWERYEQWLDETRKADFPDMINLGIEVMNGNKSLVGGRYDYVLIDEYQDVTEKQIEFIKGLLVNDKTKLFCVGDDSQTIFSYAGSDVKNIVDFSYNFQNAEEIEVPTNYRCPQTIVEAAESVISRNKTKVDKEISAYSNLSSPIILHEIDGTVSGYLHMQLFRVKQLIEEIIRKDHDGTILVLSRYKKGVMGKLKSELNELGVDKVQSNTIHSAKGTEADYVILLGCIRDKKYGFPSEIPELEVLSLAKTNQPSNVDRLEEERRLFYVALTRCRREMHIFTSKHHKSQFIDLINEYITRPANS